MASERWCQASARTAPLCDLRADREHRAEERLLDHHDTEQHEQGERRGQMMRRADLPDRLDGNDEAAATISIRPTVAAAIGSALP
jgi:hypothetical protein